MNNTVLIGRVINKRLFKESVVLSIMIMDSIEKTILPISIPQKWAENIDKGSIVGIKARLSMVGDRIKINVLKISFLEQKED